MADLARKLLVREKKRCRGEWEYVLVKAVNGYSITEQL